MNVQLPDPWAEQAIRDTVASIARDPRYGRVARESLLSRVLGWIGDRIQEFIDLFRANALLQRVAIVVLAAIATVLIVRWIIE
ncbi:MAG: hypothetical protein MUF53_09190, partial [Gemmatimonadaceae bacterium]|nr:hypothetical protein [Gemmatimonadaceae bacterium]